MSAASVRGAIGHILSNDRVLTGFKGRMRTDSAVDTVKKLTENFGIDALVCAFGASHNAPSKCKYILQAVVLNDDEPFGAAWQYRLGAAATGICSVRYFYTCQPAELLRTLRVKIKNRQNSCLSFDRQEWPRCCKHFHREVFRQLPSLR
jgi:hypothetical protein